MSIYSIDIIFTFLDSEWFSLEFPLFTIFICGLGLEHFVLKLFYSVLKALFIWGQEAVLTQKVCSEWSKIV